MTVYPDSHFLSISMRCSSLLGIFPTESLFPGNKRAQWCYRIYSKFTFGLFAFFLLTNYIQLFAIVCSGNVDFAELSKNLTITPIFTITIIRQGLMKKREFGSFIGHILTNQKVADDKEVENIEKQSSNELKNKIKIYLGMMLFTEISYTTRPLFEPMELITNDNNQTFFVKELPLSTWFPFDSEKHFKAAYAYQIADIIFGSTYDSFGEFLLISVLVYPIGRLKVLQHILSNFETYQHKLKIRYDLESDDLAAFVTLRECIRWHTNVINYVMKFNELMGTCMFLDFLQSSIHMACVLAEMMTEKVTLMQFVSVTAYLVILNFRLFLYYYYANEIIVLSENLSLAIYQSQWYKQPRKIKFMIFTILMRNLKPLRYKLGIFGDMSLKKFLSILNAAYSYVMLMYSVK